MSCECHINVIWTSYELAMYFTENVYRKRHVNFMRTSYKHITNFRVVSNVFHMQLTKYKWIVHKKADFIWNSYEVRMNFISIPKSSQLQQPSPDIGVLFNIGYPSETHLKLTSRKISFSICFSRLSFWKFAQSTVVQISQRLGNWETSHRQTKFHEIWA